LIPISGFPISAHSRYRDSRYRVCPDIGIPDIGKYPISGICNIVPDIGFNIGIYRYREIMSRYRVWQGSRWQPNQPEPASVPERTTDGGCCYSAWQPEYHFETSFNVGAGGGSADPARTSTEGAAPGPGLTTPPGGVIDHMRQLEHSRVSRAAPRAGPAMVAHKCGPVGQYRGRGPAWADNESSWAVLPARENVPEDPADEPDVLYYLNSLRLRRRHHRLPGIHRRHHSDRRAATLRGSTGACHR
jgi:hypothetical protein